MSVFTFKDIQTVGQVIAENELYRHYHFPEMLSMYDSNFIEFKRIPSLDEFKQSAEYLRKFHKSRGQNHVKFYFPENQKPIKELMAYFREFCYDSGYLELYSIQPDHFPVVRKNSNLEVLQVTEENFEAYLKLQYEEDLQFGEAFAKQKVGLHKWNFTDKNVMQVIAFYEGIPAGSVDVIISDKSVEIDNLSVLEACQRKGIGSALQRFVMDSFPDKPVILVADGEDTAREMYRKQNYQYHGFQYEVQKVYE
ncbi:acetyltransferase (GNAT) family protein [Scopulibacillus darangshiensis]|uniref:Acetyltransferase (GNAT) family protein n=1 Tax=Scopulibacillus darangshiensis TaxID=442528 RepID=A0A4R2P4N2_9BACL|nr:GNAT family N-acetyltransferase [Scopulibacillus darangshiensis]TCP29024.1 acetyltransferase (GNAT) family protein [Scopulibacillus darangshiensis]